MHHEHMHADDDHQGWIPDEHAPYEQTFAAFDESVGGAATFDGDAFDAIRNGTAVYDANKLPPLVTVESLREYLIDVRPKFELRRKAGLLLPHWEISRKLGIQRPIGNQLSYNSCSPYSFNRMCGVNRLKRIGNFGDEFDFEETNGWYTYILTGQKYGGRMSGGRTMSAPARLSHEIGMFRESIVGEYAKTAGQWSVSSTADPEASQFQACFCHIGDLPVDDMVDMIFLALECEMTTDEGTQKRVSQSGKIGGYPVAAVQNMSSGHAQGSSGVFEVDGVLYGIKEDSHNEVSDGGPDGFPQDSMLMSKQTYRQYLGGRYSDSVIIVYCESPIAGPKKGGLPT